MQPLWSPTNEQIESSQLIAFLNFLSTEYQIPLSSYEELYSWSISEKATFWQSVAKFCEIKFTTPPKSILTNPEQMPGASWFDGATLNFAENLLRFNDQRTAIISITERGHRKTLSYQELRLEVARLQAYLESLGVTKGDRVAAFMPNTWETIVAMLATTSLGAIWSSCSPEFGLQGVLDRFTQIEPKILFACDGYTFKGKAINTLEKVKHIEQSLKSIEKIILLPFSEDQTSLKDFKSAVNWTDIPDSSAELKFTAVPFNSPLYIMYSSGTTGLPKCIVHGVGGTLLQHQKEWVLHTNLTRSDTIFYFTTCGWMMWNLLVTSLAVGTTVLTYDGFPFYPKPDSLFDLIDDYKISVFGTSAKYIAALEKEHVRPVETHSLDSLKTILSTGSPLLPEHFDYVYRDIKQNLQLSSISGGTDIISCFCLGNPIAPVHRGQIQTRGLGMDVAVFDEAGHELIGEAGELVCKSPFPSMPIYFWNDPDGKTYQSAYFDKYPNVWCHGDWVKLTQQGGLIIYGRSDATLNPGGVRIGTAEIYRIVEQNQQIAESLVVGIRRDGDEEIALFLKLQNSAHFTESLKQELRQQLRLQASPRHVPKYIFSVPDIPRTISGKIVELTVRNILEGKAIKNLEALANPHALKAFEDIAKELNTNG